MTPQPQLPIYAPESLPDSDRPTTTISDRDRLIRRAKALAWLSLVWMTIEGAVGITAALAAGSVALLGFGLDSVIEAFASMIVIWRFTGSRRPSDDAEQRAQRLVAVSFFLLAPYVAQDAIRTLIGGHHPVASPVGIGLSISSLVLMPLLGRAKQRIGERLGSAATAGEGAQNMLCAYLAAGVLGGLALNAAFGAWWADPVVALAIAALAVNEGRETWRGEGCCAAPLRGGDASTDQNCCSRSVLLDTSSPMAHASCTLTDSALLEQLDRYRRLGTAAGSIAERDLGLVVRFDADVDLALVDKTIAIERGCCGFFTLDYDASDRRLSITVDDPDRLDALGVLASSLRGEVSSASAR